MQSEVDITVSLPNALPATCWMRGSLKDIQCLETLVKWFMGAAEHWKDKERESHDPLYPLIGYVDYLANVETMKTKSDIIFFPCSIQCLHLYSEN